MPNTEKNHSHDQNSSKKGMMGSEYEKNKGDKPGTHGSHKGENGKGKSTDSHSNREGNMHK